MNDNEKEAILVAYYKSIGYTVNDILEILPGFKSVATINRRLGEARNQGFLKEIAYCNIPANLFEELYPFVSDHKAATKLQAFFGKQRLQRVVIVPVPQAIQKMEAKAKDTRMRELVGRAAAVHFLEILSVDTKRKLTIGMSFGRTMLAMCNALAQMAALEPNENLKFVPLIGGLSVLRPQKLDLDPLAYQCAASTLAAELARIFRGGNIAGQIMLPTPAFITPSFAKEHPDNLDVIREFISAIPEYRRVFGDDGLIAEMDIMISSVGGPPSLGDEGGWLGEGGPILDDKERQELLDEGVVGDICGRFIQEKAVAPLEKSTTESVNARILGPNPDHFISCAQRAHINKTAGVIAVAHSPTKAKAVLSAIKNDCFSMLVIDSELAREINRLEKGLNLDLSFPSTPF